MSFLKQFDVVSPSLPAEVRTGTAGAELLTARADAPVFDESLALALDEGQNSSNAWRLHELMKVKTERSN